MRLKELNSIKVALDTMLIMIIRHQDRMPKYINTLKFSLACELSESYNIASREFINWYEKLFNNLLNRIDSEIHTREVKIIDYNSNLVLSQIDQIDYELFSKICLYIRSLLCDNFNFFTQC